ncbi:MAG: prephenate dehydratase [Eubacteriales bacterium]|nr:prephenate dehydratase [Eubacteriales bacterium]
MPEIGYLGPEGTFSQEALEIYLGRSDRTDYTPRAFSAMPDILHAVTDGKIGEAFVPIENSIEGPVNEVLDMLAFEDGLMINGEAVIPIKQNLLALKGTAVNGITTILSHPQGIGQCRNYLASYFPQVMLKPVASTAQAAREVACGEAGLAAIGSGAAARKYGLDIIRNGIQDNGNNTTRFVVISRHDSAMTGDDKTSIVFSADDKPGSLYRVLEIFNIWEINLTKIESRPAKDQLGKYIFFVDMNGHREDEDISDALRMVRRKTSFFKLLGSYKNGGAVK